MEEGTKRRFIFWLIVFIILVTFSIVGMIKYDEGYGKVGKIQFLLAPIATEFNSLDSVIRYGDLNATAKGDKIVVEYNSYKKEKYIYKYKKIDNYECIENTYTSTDITAQVIAKGIIDAVYHINNGKGSIFQKYDFKEFTKTTIEEGVKITDGSNSTISVNIKANVIDNAKNITPINIPYITSDELEGLMTSLENDGFFKITKDTKAIYVYNDDAENEFQIIIQDKNDNSDDNLYISTMNAIKIINESVYDSISSSTTKFTKDVNNEIYEIKTNQETDLDIFDINSPVIIITIKKGI